MPCFVILSLGEVNHTCKKSFIFSIGFYNIPSLSTCWLVSVCTTLNLLAQFISAVSYFDGNLLEGWDILGLLPLSRPHSTQYLNEDSQILYQSAVF